VVAASLAMIAWVVWCYRQLDATPTGPSEIRSSDLISERACPLLGGSGEELRRSDHLLISIGPDGNGPIIVPFVEIDSIGRASAYVASNSF
jgi:hypothetical protein